MKLDDQGSFLPELYVNFIPDYSSLDQLKFEIFW